jgi:hypothetical protein
MFKKGYKQTEEQKRKIGQALKGRPKSKEHIKKLVSSHLGYIQSKEERLKHSVAQKGSKGSNWRGGISTLGNLIRSCFRYRQWRSDVFTRDDFTCVHCGNRGGKLHADHIKPFSLILKENNIKTLDEAGCCEELWNINNGRTLCVECHKKTDTYLSKANKKVWLDK